MQSNNTIGTFTGTIICAPSALVFLGSSTLMFYASAGDEALSAAMNDQPSWVTFSHTWDASTTLLTVVVGVESPGVAGLLTTSFVVSGTGLNSVTVPVTLSVS